MYVPPKMKWVSEWRNKSTVFKQMNEYGLFQVETPCGQTLESNDNMGGLRKGKALTCFRGSAWSFEWYFAQIM